MTIAISWQTSVLASALYATDRLTQGESLVDGRLAEALDQPAERLTAELVIGGVEADNFWANLLPLSLTPQSTRQRVQVALTKAFGREADERLGSKLAATVNDAEQALARSMPQLDDELQLRLGPWRQLWEARGPGVLYGVRRLAETELLPETATVALIQPVSGGGGRAFPAYNCVLLEAVLTDAEPKLPEIVRLSWLLAQLNLDLPRYADLLQRDRLRRAAMLGLVPLVLAAAEDAELVKADSATLRLALENWRLDQHGPLDQHSSEDLTDLLETWYGVYCQSRPKFTAALVALDEMLGE
jgi:hypothetical protein